MRSLFKVSTVSRENKAMGITRIGERLHSTCHSLTLIVSLYVVVFTDAVSSTN